ncbi:MAG TPA: transcriptional regulator, partial [Actinoplanes sp.]|nr:transcriptional regulator [Actinoplanes sp.]
DRFADLDQRAEPVCLELAAALPRFGRYRERLGAALGRARGGALEELADSLTSYHVVWFQLHEDLLVTLGRTRG